MIHLSPQFTDPEILRTVAVMESNTVKVMARRLADRGAIAGRVQKQILQALGLIEAGFDDAAWDKLERCAAALDWSSHVPSYSLDPLED